jgi:hypothetical protein
VTQVRLPDGCSSLKLEDGTKYRAPKQGGVVDVEPQHARAITRHYGSLGIMTGGMTWTLGTRRGRICRACSRTWNVWSLVCPKCGEPTEEEPE